MNKAITLEIIDWTLVGLAVPVIFPLLFSFCVSQLYVRVDMNVCELLILLLKNGVYTFLGLTILIGLFQDYRKFPEVFTLSLYLGVFYSSLMIGFIFLSSLGFVPKEAAISYEQNIDAFVIVTVGILSLSFFFKYKILKVKYSSL
jgi:hypothetical protein